MKLKQQRDTTCSRCHHTSIFQGGNEIASEKKRKKFVFPFIALLFPSFLLFIPIRVGDASRGNRGAYQTANQLALRREEYDSPHVDVLGERKGRVAVDRDLWKPSTEACSPLCVWRGRGSKGKGRGGVAVYGMLDMNDTIHDVKLPVCMHCIALHCFQLPIRISCQTP